MSRLCTPSPLFGSSYRNLGLSISLCSTIMESRVQYPKRISSAPLLSPANPSLLCLFFLSPRPLVACPAAGFLYSVCQCRLVWLTLLYLITLTALCLLYCLLHTYATRESPSLVSCTFLLFFFALHFSFLFATIFFPLLADVDGQLNRFLFSFPLPIFFFFFFFFFPFPNHQPLPKFPLSSVVYIFIFISFVRSQSIARNLRELTGNFPFRFHLAA